MLLILSLTILDRNARIQSRRSKKEELRNDVIRTQLADLDWKERRGEIAKD